jgi:tetratricopeptide (TPR) repeat protein
MSKFGKLTIWGILILAALGISGWFYYENRSSMDEASEPNAVSIESGIALFKEKKYAEAIEVFEQIPAGHPREWYSLYYLGSTYIMMKNYPTAIEHLEMALSLNTTETQIMHALGVAYFKQGNLKMAKGYFAAVLEIKPDDAEARGLMDIMARLERNQQAANPQEAADDKVVEDQ